MPVPFLGSSPTAHDRVMTQEPVKKVSIIGAPTDIGAGTRGASMGPEALRVAQLQAMLESQGVAGADRGNLQGPGEPGAPPVDGYRHLPQVIAWNRTVFEACRKEFHAKRLPIVLGGDHCLAIGTIAAAATQARASGT